MKTVTVFLLVFAWGVGAFAQSGPPLAPLPNDGFVTAEQIVSDFAANPAAASQKYSGRAIRVYGTVSDIRNGNGEEGEPLIVFLQSSRQSSPDVKAKFPANSFANGVLVNIAGDGSTATLFRHKGNGAAVNMNVYVTKGERFAVFGNFGGFVAGDIVLNNCRKVRPAVLQNMLRKAQ